MYPLKYCIRKVSIVVFTSILYGDLCMLCPQGSKEGRGSLTLMPEELTLDYIEVTAIPPLPLWLLLEADKDTQNHQAKKTDNKEDVSRGSFVVIFKTELFVVRLYQLTNIDFHL